LSNKPLPSHAFFSEVFKKKETTPHARAPWKRNRRGEKNRFGNFGERECAERLPGDEGAKDREKAAKPSLFPVRKT